MTQPHTMVAPEKPSEKPKGLKIPAAAPTPE